MLVTLLPASGDCASSSYDLLRSGGNEFQAGRWDKAKQIYTDLADRLRSEPLSDPRRFACQYHLALIAEQSGDYAEALKQYETCLRSRATPAGPMDLSNSSLQAHMAVIELKLGHKDQAQSLYQSSMAALDSALRLFLTKQPESASNKEGSKRAAELNKHGLELVAQRKYAESLELLKEANQQDPDRTCDNLAHAHLAYANSLSATPEKALEQYYQCLFYRRSDQAALNGLDAAIRALHKDPAKAADRMAMAREAASSGDMTGASIECGEALRIDPGAVSPSSTLYPHGAISQAVYYEDRKEYGKAIELLTAALQKIPPGDSEAAQAILHWLAECYDKSGDTLQYELTSLREVEMSERLGQPTAAFVIRIYDVVARIYEKRGEKKDARAYYDKLVAKFQTLPPEKRTRFTALGLRDACDFFEREDGIVAAAPILVSALENYMDVSWRDDIDFDSYNTRVSKTIEDHWTPAAKQHKGDIVTQFRITREGFVEDLHIVEGGGEAVADAAAIKAVYDSEPFNALPSGSGAAIDIQFTFNLK